MYLAGMKQAIEMASHYSVDVLTPPSMKGLTRGGELINYSLLAEETERIARTAGHLVVILDDIASPVPRLRAYREILLEANPSKMFGLRTTPWGEGGRDDELVRRCNPVWRQHDFNSTSFANFANIVLDFMDGKDVPGMKPSGEWERQIAK